MIMVSPLFYVDDDPSFQPSAFFIDMDNPLGQQLFWWLNEQIFGLLRGFDFVFPYFSLLKVSMVSHF